MSFVEMQVSPVITGCVQSDGQEEILIMDMIDEGDVPVPPDHQSPGPQSISPLRSRINSERMDIQVIADSQ